MIERNLTPTIQSSLARGKSILLLGPRQTGKTTLITQAFQPDQTISFVEPQQRSLYEKNPQRFVETIKAMREASPKKPLIFLDEVQKIPQLMDAVQFLIDGHHAQFILSGSSARKLRYGNTVNCLPGRVVVLHLDPLSIKELPTCPDLADLLLFGSLPGIRTTDAQTRDLDLLGYVSTYLEDEIRTEAQVRNLGHFARFLELAASESGGLINHTRLAQDIGISDNTIANYFQILQDSLIIERIEPLSGNKRRLIRSSKYVFFDVGVRRVCANEGESYSPRTLGLRFEEWIGMELIKLTRHLIPRVHLRYWRTSNQLEVDYVLECEATLIPIEVKWTENPSDKDIKHLIKMMADYNLTQGFVICRCPLPFRLHPHILALPWQQLDQVLTLLPW